MQILADKIIANAAGAFSVFGEVSLFDGRELQASMLKRADVLLVRSVTPVDAELLNGTPVKFVGTATAGVDHVNIQSLQDAHIEFASAPGCNANAVAEFIATSILAFCAKEDLDIDGTQVAIIGHGAVGTRVEHKLSALGFGCVINDPFKAREKGRNAIDTDYVSLDSALQADIVTLHTPLTADGPNPTEGLIDAARIASMTNCRLLINAARGGIVHESALVERLVQDARFNCQIDCWQGEPRINLELIANTFRASPHVAGHSVEARRNATWMLVESLRNWLLEESSLGEVDANRQGGNVDYNMPTQASEQEINLRLSNIDLKHTVPALAQLLAQCCPVDEINQAMRELGSLSTEKAATEFDLLRRRFAARREFACYKLPVELSPGFAQNSLPSLGFRLS